jgi:hypothetical protein
LNVSHGGLLSRLRTDILSAFEACREGAWMLRRSIAWLERQAGRGFWRDAFDLRAVSGKAKEALNKFEF